MRSFSGTTVAFGPLLLLLAGGVAAEASQDEASSSTLPSSGLASGSSSVAAGDLPSMPSGAGSLLWQVPMAGYSMVRPALGPDGTVYAVDVFSTLYAVAPNGVLRWQVSGAGNKGLAVAADGTIYVASEAAVRAYNPNGTVHWTFIQNPGAFLLVGLSIGPDGNLYAVASNGLGVFSLTPNGALRWTSLELYQQPIISYGEIVFGPGTAGTQLYFYANAHVRGLRLDGSPVFGLLGGGQPVVSPLDGTVHRAGEVDTPDGAWLWNTGIGGGETPAVGQDGTHYGVFLGTNLYALDPSGQVRWQVTSPRYLREPTTNPAGTLVLLAAADPSTFAGSLEARAASDGALLWNLPLPATQRVDNPGVRFTPDGARAYFVSTTGGPSFLTAVAMTPGFSDGFELGHACGWSATLGGGCP